MFSRIKDFLYKHRKKFLVSGIVIGGSVLLSKYAHKRFIEWQEKETKEFLERTRKQYQFENTERTCNQTILSLASQLKNEICKCFDTETLLLKLRTKHDDKKLLIWEDLKILAFARHTALIYCGLMLSIVLRIQVNVVGGFMAKDPNCEADSSFQESYLSLCQYFINTGVKAVCKLIEKHIKIVFNDVGLKSKVNLVDIEHLFWSVQSSICEDKDDPLSNLPKYLFSSESLPQTNNQSSTKQLKQFFDQTVTLLESDEISALAQNCIGRAHSNSIDSLAEYFVPKAADSEDGSIQANGVVSIANKPLVHPNNISIPMAKVIPIIHGLTKICGNDGESDPWIYQFVVMDNIKEVGANVFDTFST